MRVFLAGAAGAIGRQLVPMLLADGHAVWGTTRSAQRAPEIRSAGATPAIVDAFDAQALRNAVSTAEPDVIVHQLTDLARGFGHDDLVANSRLREIGTRNLVEAALAAGVRRVVAQGVAWLYRIPGEHHRVAGHGAGGVARMEDDPLLTLADAPGDPVLPGVLALEDLVLRTRGIDGIVLRYGFLYGPGTSDPRPARSPSVHVAAAAKAAALAVATGLPGPYNIVDDDQGVSNAKAARALGWRPDARS